MIYSGRLNILFWMEEDLGLKGTAIGLFGQWLKWLFFSIITLGIYLFWVNIALKNGRLKILNLNIKNNSSQYLVAFFMHEDGEYVGNRSNN